MQSKKSNNSLFLYHKVPKYFTGKILYPLNKLKSLLPEVYKLELVKYEGREDLMTLKIPLLDCLWNDVLHLSPIPPHEIKFALKEAGYTPRPTRYFVIDPSSLAVDDVVIYTFNHDTREVDERDMLWFDYSRLKAYVHLPEKTKKYFKSEFQKGVPYPLLHMHAPHIFYKGTIDVSGCKIIGN